jgi:hypothetical protein
MPVHNEGEFDAQSLAWPRGRKWNIVGTILPHHAVQCYLRDTFLCQLVGAAAVEMTVGLWNYCDKHTSQKQAKNKPVTSQ